MPARISPPPAANPSSGLTKEQLDFWNTNGYLLIPDALSPETTKALLDEAYTMLDNFSLDDHPMTKFSTGEKSDHVGDDYFLDSGDKVRFFFEEGVFVSHSLVSILKLHTLTQSYQTHSTPKATSQSPNPKPSTKSVTTCTQPEIGGRVPPHQDSTFLYTDPPSAVGFWYALEDATAENGCLSFAAGSHKRAPIRSRFVRTSDSPDATGTGFAENHGSQWPQGLQEDTEVKKEVYELGEVKAGTLVLIHGNLLHKSEKNTSLKGRMIYTFHCIEGGNDHDL
ncbi:phytanoyl-CoA dioxygenase, partial [Aureobasidium melanogenum]